MPQSVDLSDDLLALARREAQRQGRSVADQIAHWARIGRAIEASESFDHKKIEAALSGRMTTSELTLTEKAVWLDSFTDGMGQPGPDEEAFYARRRELGLGEGY